MNRRSASSSRQRRHDVGEIFPLDHTDYARRRSPSGAEAVKFVPPGQPPRTALRFRFTRAEKILRLFRRELLSLVPSRMTSIAASTLVSDPFSGCCGYNKLYPGNASSRGVRVRPLSARCPGRSRRLAQAGRHRARSSHRGPGGPAEWSRPASPHEHVHRRSRRRSSGTWASSTRGADVRALPMPTGSAPPVNQGRNAIRKPRRRNLRRGAVRQGGGIEKAAPQSAPPSSLAESTSHISRIRLHSRAMPRAENPYPLTSAEARRIWLRAQRLDTPAPFGEGPPATAAAVEHLGYVQIDTINVIERCHHHILWTRIPGLSARRSAAGPERRQEACSNTGPMRCPMCRRRICASSSPP